jgi:hypothetical protein
MTDEQPRTDATSRERSPDHQYTLSIGQTAELYAKRKTITTTGAELLVQFSLQRKCRRFCRFTEACHRDRANA